MTQIPTWEQEDIVVPDHLWRDNRYLEEMALVFLDQILPDDWSFIRGLLEKYQEGDTTFRFGVNIALLTVTGWTLPTLAKMAYERTYLKDQ